MSRYLRPNCLFFLLLHVAAVLIVVLVPPTAAALWLLVAFYLLRMFAITAGYHRYFSHRSYDTSRFWSFLLGAVGCSAIQRGPIWWASRHRLHHKHSDREGDPHSPILGSVWWAHVGWVLEPDASDDLSNVEDLTRCWELRLLERCHYVPGVLLAGFCWWVGGWSGLAWGFAVGTVALYHCTFLVNSVCHLVGSRRYETPDRSRNNFLVALLTMGEGWHNNHHHRQGSVRQGQRWWEVDVAYYVLWVLHLARIVRLRDRSP